MSTKDELIEKIADESGVTSGDAWSVLCWLDRHPGQVPGRTITEKEFTDAFEYFFDYDQTDKHREYLGELGITVVPDPEPTNAAKATADLETWGMLRARALELGPWLAGQGWTKAPEK